METNFWHQRWAQNNIIGFHLKKANPLLIKYIGRLEIKKDDRVFIPLCGKTLDIGWLLSKGYRVVGAELSEMATKQLFKELKMKPKVSKMGELKRYQHKNIDIFVGNVFNVTKDMIGVVNAVYDRAALVALPKDMRQRYSKHIMHLTNAAPQLLIAYEYDQRKIQGPPFSIKSSEVKRHYKDQYKIQNLASIDVAGGMKGKCPAKESIWLLEKK